MNSASISRAIKAGTRVSKSTIARGRVSSVISEGYISTQHDEIVKVQYVSSSNRISDQGWKIFDERRDGAIYIIAKILTRKGYAVTRIGNTLEIRENK